jgi:hypothetical protein
MVLLVRYSPNIQATVCKISIYYKHVNNNYRSIRIIRSHPVLTRAAWPDLACGLVYASTGYKSASVNGCRASILLITASDSASPVSQLQSGFIRIRVRKYLVNMLLNIWIWVVRYNFDGRSSERSPRTVKELMNSMYPAFELCRRANGGFFNSLLTSYSVFELTAPSF